MDLTQRVQAHTEHIKNVGSFCTTEETTKQALILPLLDILGFSAFDPTKVRSEYTSDFPGAKFGERVDYALFKLGVPVMFIEAKAFNQSLTNHCPQLSRYYNATPAVAIGAITNGREWRFFTDLVNKNIMDEKPFMTLHLDTPKPDLAQQLMRFHYDQFQVSAGSSAGNGLQMRLALQSSATNCYHLLKKKGEYRLRKECGFACFHQ